MKEKGILNKFRNPCHDFIKKVSNEENKCFLTINVEGLLTSIPSQAGIRIRKRIEENLYIFKIHLSLLKSNSKFFFSPLETLLNQYEHSGEFKKDVENYNKHEKDVAKIIRDMNVRNLKALDEQIKMKNHNLNDRMNENERLMNREILEKAYE